MVWLGCASPKAVEETAATIEATADEAVAATPEEGIDTAEAAPVESSITVDPETQAVSGKASVAVLRPIADEAAFTKEKRGVDALIEAINSNTQIECKLHGIVSITDLASLQAPLLVVSPEPDLKTTDALNALGEYVARGGVVLVDGSWTGNILPSGTRITPRSSHAIMQDPYKLGESRQRRFRPFDAIQVGDRLGVIVMNQNYATFWSGSSGTEQTWATRLGINVLVYALKTSSFSKQGSTAPDRGKQRPGGVSPIDIAPI